MKPSLIILCGVPGSGKTTIARIMCQRMNGSVHIQTDTIRGMIAKPNYRSSESAFVYDSCVEVARRALRCGRPAILDGTFARRSHRDSALHALRGLYGQCLVVHAVCRIETAERRNRSRGVVVVPEERLKGIYTSFEEPYRALSLDTESRSADESASLVLDTIARRSARRYDLDGFRTYQE